MEKAKAGYTEGIVSILVNTILFGLKLWAGIVSGSIALIADAWHTLSDSISSVVVIIGVKLSSRKPDKEHPFGHGRWEQIAAIFIGFILAIVAYNFFVDSIERFSDHETVKFGTLAIIVTIISILGKEALAQYAFYLARKTDNISIKADGWHHRSDAVSSVLVLIGIFFAKRFWWVDSILGIIISLLLFYATFVIVKEAINRLLGEKPSEELISKVRTIIREKYSNEMSSHHFHIHNYITHQELTFHIKLDNSMNLETAHKIATEIENSIHEKLGIVATVHMEPSDYEHKSD
ncbi:MAG TPA: cation diffusion facilitator family transporter [Bacteroidales bacterium]|nr:cation diffusion facilitator family transporter [Bacteroidales bacterium]